jgi:Zn-dependent protease
MFFQTAMTDRTYFLAVVITVIVSICIHELAHGVVAVWLGDRTPIESGHMTLNPAVHMGMFSVIALLLAGIAWGAMPINPSRLRGRYGEALVAIAGPVSNVLLALLALTALGLWLRHDEGWMPPDTRARNLQYFLIIFGLVNFHLALFNLIPIPPLDGARVLENFSDAYKRVSEHLSTGGASIMVLVVAFTASGKVIAPASARMAIRFLGSVSGLDAWTLTRIFS